MTEQEIRDEFFRTRDARAAIASRTSRVDAIVRQHWLTMPPNVALMAVGGYGRRELFPFSDIDLLILTPDDKTRLAIDEPLSLMLRDLWDSGLRISQSVHTPAECNRIDETNAERAVSLLDRRLLAGDQVLFREVRDPEPELGANIVELTRARHTHYQNTIYHLEPDVKNSPGGLRDLQVLRWLAQLGETSDDAGDDLSRAGVPVLFEVRCFLHYLSGRDDNKFTFERQDEIARLIGSPSPEMLMRDYYRAVRGIARQASRRLEMFEAGSGPLFSKIRDRASRLSNSEFAVASGIISFQSPQAPESDPGIILRAFAFMATHGLPLASDTEDCIERSLPAFQRWVETHQPLWPAISALFRLPHAVKALRAMHETRSLEALFPELRKTDALVIRDFYHRYTVDEHTLVAIETAMNLRSASSGDFFTDLALETEDPDLLITALLFHDVGKAEAGESHSVVSRRVAEAALKRCGIDERSLAIVSFLIEAHLEMSATMSGRDMSDPATIRETASRTATVERLKLLTLLTYGDISAVNPGAMTPWRRQLLWNLYTQTHSQLTRELIEHAPPPAASLNPRLREMLEGLPPRYSRIHSDAEMAEHLALYLQASWRGIAVSLKRTAAWSLTIVGDDRPFLFASVAATLSSFGFNILKAEAFSNIHGTVIDTFTFADPGRRLELNPEEEKQVTETVIQTINGEVSVEQLLSRRPRVKPDVYALGQARTSFDNAASPTATLIEMVSQDRPRLLYDVASLISQRGANIEVVLVDTEARKAIDVFYLTKNGAKLTDDEARELTAAVSEIARPS